MRLHSDADQYAILSIKHDLFDNYSTQHKEGKEQKEQN
jgi:hypothetical protein